MKKIIITSLVLLALTISSTNLSAQGPPPPPGSGHGQTGNQNGGSAPIGGGLFILLGLGAAYSGRKIYEILKEEGEAGGKLKGLEN